MPCYHRVPGTARALAINTTFTCSMFEVVVYSYTEYKYTVFLEPYCRQNTILAVFLEPYVVDKIPFSLFSLNHRQNTILTINERLGWIRRVKEGEHADYYVD